ncbi:hypothetical protein HDZ31DRAFT_40574 [Schizophyllum fasciatum]
MLEVPAISITNPTPPRPLVGIMLTAATSPESAKLHKSAYRLLYRGSLSLPDSYMLLDGLTFSACLDKPSAGHDLLENPLALALESMRGRPSLRFMGTITLQDIYMDQSGAIQLDIHRDAALSRLYFENIFCQLPLSSSSTTIPQSQIGVKIALGDTDGPETTYMVVYARQPPCQAEIQLSVARISPAPPPTNHLRLPRPDDPTPRKPPPVLTAKGTDLKRVASSSSLQTNGNGKGPSKRPRLDFARDSSFKVPIVPRALPSKKGKERAATDAPFPDATPDPDDVFSAPAKPPPMEDSQMEKDNRMMVKKMAVQILTTGIGYGDPETSPTPPIPKTHPEFKDLYNWVYRGAAYALRGEMKDGPLPQKKAERLVKIHVGMYAPGLGRG